MGHARTLQAGNSWTFTTDVNDGTSLGVIVSDVLYVVLTIIVFTVLFLILKGVERFER
jgi:hypothetical protein